eukprot:CAMPEP_0182953380 /NCGR_PEP_ID=MMETSP0105_2-20130417/62245_1 /TAXON_ID=81532 ORGANISM="Acanthoeca-like sp., Strain 10tr" /NCGR_SAMPLE_ID=MMETSP0105_2 /ASSEMBLY_ACC=CAM_ASM_000205 /LENGTH=51 /DNA_ID=CAMNT_0025093701 /DNA_START=175 /DNA_END=333 /DNA_ORIENTATION=-
MENDPRFRGASHVVSSRMTAAAGDLLDATDGDTVVVAGECADLLGEPVPTR